MFRLRGKGIADWIRVYVVPPRAVGSQFVKLHTDHNQAIPLLSDKFFFHKNEFKCTPISMNSVTSVIYMYKMYVVIVYNISLRPVIFAW